MEKASAPILAPGTCNRQMLSLVTGFRRQIVPSLLPVAIVLQLGETARRKTGASLG
jgi:hypothetical protein